MISGVISALRSLSVVGLLVTLIIIYANLPDKIGFERDVNGFPEASTSRTTFFYVCLLLFTLINGVFIFLSRMVEKTPDTGSKFREGLLTWLNGLALLINIFFITSLVFINAFNSLEKLDLDNFGIVVLVIAGLTITWALGLAVVLRLRGR